MSRICEICGLRLILKPKCDDNDDADADATADPDATASVIQIVATYNPFQDRLCDIYDDHNQDHMTKIITVDFKNVGDECCSASSASSASATLYLGGFQNARNLLELKSFKIEKLINMACELTVSPKILNSIDEKNNIEHLKFSWDDDTSFPIEKDLHAVADAIHSGLAAKKNVLVHCMIGKI